MTSMRMAAVAAAFYPAATAARPHAPTAVGGQALSYDSNGDLQSGRGRTFVWDGESRPSSIAMAGKTVSFDYGPEGGRVKKTAPTAADAACPTPPAATETLTFGDVQCVTKPVGAAGAWVATPEWTSNVHADAKTVKIGTAVAKADASAPRPSADRSRRERAPVDYSLCVLTVR